MPYLVCDEPSQEENVTYYTIRGLGAGGFADPLTVPAWPGSDFGFKLDISNLTPGAYTVHANACNEFKCSTDSDPFVCTVPEAPSAPRGLRISFAG